MFTARPAMAPLLPGLFALLMLHWSAASLLPRESASFLDWPPGVRVAETDQPVILSAVARTVAAKLRTLEKTWSPNDGKDLAASAARTGPSNPFADLLVGPLGTCHGSCPLRAFDARAPPATAQG